LAEPKELAEEAKEAKKKRKEMRGGEKEPSPREKTDE